MDSILSTAVVDNIATSSDYYKDVLTSIHTQKSFHVSSSEYYNESPNISTRRATNNPIDSTTTLSHLHLQSTMDLQSDMVGSISPPISSINTQSLTLNEKISSFLASKSIMVSSVRLYTENLLTSPVSEATSYNSEPTGKLFTINKAKSNSIDSSFTSIPLHQSLTPTISSSGMSSTQKLVQPSSSSIFVNNNMNKHSSAIINSNSLQNSWNKKTIEDVQTTSSSNVEMSSSNVIVSPVKKNTMIISSYTHKLDNDASTIHPHPSSISSNNVYSPPSWSKDTQKAVKQDNYWVFILIGTFGCLMLVALAIVLAKKHK